MSTARRSSTGAAIIRDRWEITAAFRGWVAVGKVSSHAAKDSATARSMLLLDEELPEDAIREYRTPLFVVQRKLIAMVAGRSPETDAAEWLHCLWCNGVTSCRVAPIRGNWSAPLCPLCQVNSFDLRDGRSLKGLRIRQDGHETTKLDEQKPRAMRSRKLG